MIKYNKSPKKIIIFSKFESIKENIFKMKSYVRTS